MDTVDGNTYGGTVYSYPCDSNPEVGFSFGGIDGQVFNINPADFNLGTARQAWKYSLTHPSY